MRLDIRKAKNPREGKTLHTCTKCTNDIEVGELNMEIQGYNKKVEKRYSNYYHQPCAIDWLNNLFRLRAEKKTKRDPEPMQKTRTKNIEATPELITRRRRILEYLNRDRRKLEKYYITGDTEQISRKLALIASRIDELADIGLEFKLNQLSDLILEHDRKTLERMANVPGDWRKRADVLRESAQAWAGKSSHRGQA